jgi:hypothetical protein
LSDDEDFGDDGAFENKSFDDEDGEENSHYVTDL